MKLAPCVFTLHIEGHLEAMATVHVDDVLVAGSARTDSVWRSSASASPSEAGLT